MNFRDLTEIKQLRRKYHLNQKELAQRAEVSQSLIAKVEAGKVEPSYSKAKLIFEALDQLREKEEAKAKDIMNKKISFAEMGEPLKEIIKAMKSKGISQLPVLSKEKICGIITEGSILRKMLEQPEKSNLFKAEDVMEEAPPIVTLNSGFHTISVLLRDHPIVLVAERGDIKGIISKSDLLGRIE
ncbi:CBS domain-containing protein [Candidatus Woesearchaeota archaeon]|nr:CBS domain-containing protein [Candidatus Woesearchaeota archaeon]